VVMSQPATGSAERGQLHIGSPREPDVQAAYRAVAKQVAAETGCAFLDLHEAWIEMAGAGWEAAYAHGLMADTMHPSQRGHDEIARRVAAKLGLAPD
jgi:lysophospholipase L1-like esterase